MRTFQITILFLLFSSVLHPQTVKENGHLKVVGTQLTNEKGKPVVLRGMSFGWHNWWPRFYNKNSVKWLASDWHCSVVRAAMGVEPEHGYLKEPKAAKEKIEAVVQGAIDAGIYVIIDWHSHNINWNESKQFFAEMAAKYGKYPNVIYEIYNEPDYETWDSVRLYSNAVISTIRSFDPDNIILVGNPHWDQDIHLVADKPLTGFSNIMYTVHFYAATHKQWLRDQCSDALKKGIPIFISESAGMEASGDGPINKEEWEKWISWAEQNKISWITWSVSDKDETCSVLQKSASSDGNWKTEDLKESGILARELIRKHSLKK
jgi:endoglucanase